MPNGVQSLLEPIYGPGATPESILSMFKGGEQFTGFLQPLFGIAEEALGAIEPARAQQEAFARQGATLGRSALESTFTAGRTGLEQGLIGRGRGFQAARARTGFAGGGALEQLQGRERRATATEFQNLLGRRRTGVAGIGAGLEQDIFGIGQKAIAARSGVQASLTSGITGLLQSLLGRGVGLAGGDLAVPSPTELAPVSVPDVTNQGYIKWLFNVKGATSSDADNPILWQEYQEYLASGETAGDGKGVFGDFDFGEGFDFEDDSDKTLGKLLF